MVGKHSMQGQIALSLTGKVPGSSAAPSAPSIAGIFHKNGKKRLSTALLLVFQFLHQRMKVLEHYKEMDLENVSDMP